MSSTPSAAATASPTTTRVSPPTLASSFSTPVRACARPGPWPAAERLT
jgi:hypothetical protein